MACAGCHEPRRAAPGLAASPPRHHYPELNPPTGPRYPGGLSFPRTVQPVLDRHCIACHGLAEKPAGGISLLGTLDAAPIRLGHPRTSIAYQALTQPEGLAVVAHRNQETVLSKPGDYGARPSRLAQMLREGHGGRVNLPSEDFRRIAQWLDLNGPFYGDYSWNKPEWRQVVPEAETRLRAALAERFGSTFANQPFAALVNAADPAQSRALLGGLAVEAGGWGQLSPLFPERDAPWQHLRDLVDATLAPLLAHDLAGTCQQTPCECRACWIPPAEAEYQARRMEKPNR